LTFDGDDRTAKRDKRQRIYASPPTGWYYEPEYYIYSSVTGQKITDLDQYGQKLKTNVFMGSAVIYGDSFMTTDPITGSNMTTDLAGAIPQYDAGRVELEALGAIVPTQEPEIQEPPHSYGKGGSIFNPEFGSCAIDGSLQPTCRDADQILATGNGEIGPLNPYAALRIYEQPGTGRRRYEYVPWERDEDGRFRYQSVDLSIPASDEPEVVRRSWTYFLGDRFGASEKQNDNPKCWTVNLLIREQRVLDAFEKARKASAKSGNENGGFMFVDLQSGDVHIFEGSEGLKDEMPKLYKEIGAKAKSLGKSGRPYAFLTMYHTHPRGGWTASTWDISSFRDDRIAFVIYPEGNYKGPLAFYDGSNPSIPRGSPRLDRCLLSYDSK
jgi:hypothetical protein